MARVEVESDDSYPSSSSSSEFEDEEELCRTLSLRPLCEQLLPPGAVVPRPKTSRGRSRNCLEDDDDDDAFYPLPLPVPGDDVEVPMEIDTHEHIWTRTRDVIIGGTIMEYVGPGIGVSDNGFAQSEVPLSPINHYFEVTILEPGDACYIAVGVARKDYPVTKHPGWNRGSVAFHADDGKLFIGSGIGSPFGPRCAANDVLGCGIIFPINHGDPSAQDVATYGDGIGKKPLWAWEETAYVPNLDEQRVKLLRRLRREFWVAQRVDQDELEALDVRDEDAPSDEDADLNDSEDEVWWNNINLVYDEKVKVFFRLNGKLLGVKEVRIPRGGFYPTIGMMGRNEKISVDLFPLTG